MRCHWKRGNAFSLTGIGSRNDNWTVHWKRKNTAGRQKQGAMTDLYNVSRRCVHRA